MKNLRLFACFSIIFIAAFLLIKLSIKEPLALLILSSRERPHITQSLLGTAPAPEHADQIFYALFPNNKRPLHTISTNEKLKLAINFAGGNFLHTNIPRIIHHSWKTSKESDMDPSVKFNLKSFREKNPSALQIIWDDADILLFVTMFYPTASAFFISLPTFILRADLFRYMVLATFGGVYSDVDTECLKPIEQWVEIGDNVNFIVGVEADPDRPDWNEWYSRRLQWVQWTLASAPGHKSMTGVVLGCLSHMGSVKSIKGQNVMDMTGPGVWTDHVNLYLSSIGVSWKKELLGLKEAKRFEDTLVLTITAFSPGVGHMGSMPISDSKALVQHKFLGSWKMAD